MVNLTTSDERGGLHINVLELHAIWLVAQAFEDILQDSNVAILCSNVSAICLSVKTGGHSVSKMCHTASYTCDWTGKRCLFVHFLCV